MRAKLVRQKQEKQEKPLLKEYATKYAKDFQEAFLQQLPIVINSAVKAGLYESLIEVILPNFDSSNTYDHKAFTQHALEHGTLILRSFGYNVTAGYKKNCVDYDGKKWVAIEIFFNWEE